MVSGPSERFRNVLLVGFMGSGKSTVGRRLAERLGWDFHDFDDEIERRAGCTIAQLFADRGEPAFRALEARVGAELLGCSRAVLAAGGGWAAQEGRMDALGADTFTVWLDVDAPTAVERVRREGETRPLLQGDDPLLLADGLLRERERHYARARLRLDTRGASPGALVDAIVDHMSDAPAPGAR
jgi:shikimate kinase